MNLRNILVLIASFSLSFTLYAQDDMTEETATDTTEASDESMDEPMDEGMGMEEELLEYEEEEAAGPLDGFSAGFTGSVGFVNGEYITNTPVGGSLVIMTPYGFDLGGLGRFSVSLAFGSYSGQAETGMSILGIETVVPVDINPSVMGVGGNLTLAKMVFAEGHAGLVGDGMGIRGFAGVSLERIMKKSLGLPVNILVGGEGFISTELMDGGEKSFWGGLGARLDYSF